jgi:DNA helicase II / ATP-dependent DNA helicase PcrA
MMINLSDVGQAALAAEGTVLVTGGPGSGKTTLALLRAQRLIPALEPGQKILLLSFSRAAVRQVLIRCKDILSSAERQRIAVKTYHAFCMEILKSHGRLLNGKRPGILFPGPERLAKSRFDGDWTAEIRRLAAEEGQYAFSTFAANAADLLAKSASVRELISSTYPDIILDEFQDTDDAQWALVQQLALGSTLIALADPDQRIFDYQADIDPQRLSQLRSTLSPQEFDFGGDNHRSPNARILAFADAVMANAVLPVASDVQQVQYFPRNHEQTVHAAVVWLLSKLRRAGVESPSVAVLGRSNPYVGELSLLLGREHTYNGQPLKPVDHHVVWDAELTAAAAQVVASILEWPLHAPAPATATTLDAIAAFYDMKNAERPSNSAQRDAGSYRTAAARVRSGNDPRPMGAKAIKAACEAGIVLTGDPFADWTAARALLESSDKLGEVFTAARYVRLFRATDEIGGRLSAQWAETGTYRDARNIVRRTLDLGRLLATETEPRGVVLMTLHKSKGKEFDGVVIVEGRYSGVFFDDRREKMPFAATRRLLRVGITRARLHVIILRPNGAPPLSGAAAAAGTAA